MKIEKLTNTDETTSTSTLSKSTISDNNDYDGADFQSLINENSMNNFSLATQNMNLISTDLTMDYDSLTISQDDAIFFNDLVNNPQFALNASKGELINLNEISPTTDIQTYKSISVSKGLFNLITKAQETQKPVRLDFDNNVTVIMKVDKEGKISAEFIPGDKAVEAYLRNNIPYLKQRFEEQNIVYNDLYYRQSNRQHQQQRQYKGESENE